MASITNNPTTAERVTTLVANAIGLRCPDVRLDSRFIEDLHCAAVDIVAIIMEVEDQFHFEISDDQVQACETVGDLIALVEQNAVTAP